MKKLFTLLLVSVLVLSLTACAGEDNSVELQTQIDELAASVTQLETDLQTALDNLETEQNDLSGTYVGYSWKGEASGTLLEDASQKIETTLTLDADGTIVDAEMLFWKLKDGSWYTRQDGTAHVSADLSVTPIAATPGSSYAKGTSMFTVDTHDFMSLYAVEVDEAGNAAFLFVDPITRYQFEILLPVGYDFTTQVSTVTVDGTPGGFIPTVRTSGSGLFKPASWTELVGMNMFSISMFSHVMQDTGVFEGLNGDSTMQELLESVGVVFTEGVPTTTDGLDYGRHSNGGWQGNYEAIAAYLIGKNVSDITTLVDWDVERWNLAINENNIFGVDLVAGATKTAQNSLDTIAGATVRMSRESTSFQRALVAAGVISEEDIIIGRF